MDLFLFTNFQPFDTLLFSPSFPQSLGPLPDTGPEFILFNIAILCTV